MINLETILIEKIRALPIEKQERVLKSVEEIEREQPVNGNKNTPDSKTELKSKRFSFIGIGSSKTGDISVRAEEILMEEVDKRSGFTVKDERLD